MPDSHYQPDPTTDIHQGAIYEFRPIFWLDPPLWIAQNVEFHDPARTDLIQWKDFARAFHNSADNQEFVLATAKVRFLVILSSTRESREHRLKEVRVAPIYSIDPNRMRPDFLEGLKRGSTLRSFICKVIRIFEE